MSPRPSIRLSFVLACLAIPALAQQQSAPPRPAIDPRLYAGLSWRNVGPFRGGRVSATAGAIGQPGVFYAGYPGGGVWKTTSAGATWTPVFDSVRDVSSIGSVAVAPSNPDVVYVGTGDMITADTIQQGNGVYKSTDAGKTWQHLGSTARSTSLRSAPIPGTRTCSFSRQRATRIASLKSAASSAARTGGRTWTRVSRDLQRLDALNVVLDGLTRIP